VGKKNEKKRKETFEKPTSCEYFEYLLEKAKAQEKANLVAN
jgi:hypothetical protein